MKLIDLVTSREVSGSPESVEPAGSLPSRDSAIYDEVLHADSGPFRVLFERSPEGMILVDPHDPKVVAPIIACNESAARMNGYTREELLGKPISLLTRDPDSHEELQTYIDRLRTEGLIAEEDVHYRKDGSAFPLEFSTVMITLGERELILGIDRDITQRKLLEDALAHQAMHDSLTDLPNRSFLRNRLRDAIDNARSAEESLALLFLDLDGFKHVNDSFGHSVGDDLLTEVARRMERLLGKSEMVSRLGGDEFAVVLPEARKDEANRFMRRILAAFQAPFEVEEHLLSIRTSIGCSLFPEHGDEPSTLMRRADIAMYTAKRMGLVYTIYSPEHEPTGDGHVLHRRPPRVNAYEGAG